MNSDNHPWPSDIKLVRVSGDQLKTKLYVSQNEVKPGDYLHIMLTLKAPLKPGKYFSVYRLVQ